MFGGRMRFFRKEMRKTTEALSELDTRLHNILFNKISITDAIRTLEKIESDYHVWRDKIGQESEYERARIVYKNERALKDIDKLFSRIRKYIAKKNNGVVTSIKPDREKSASQANQQDKKEKTLVGSHVSSADSDEISDDDYPKGVPSGEVALNNPEGIVANFRQETEVRRSIFNTIRKVHTRLLDPISGRLDPPTKKILFVWRFNLELKDHNRKLTFSVPIEMRGGRLKGNLTDGDYIRVDGKWKWSSGQTIEVTSVYNKNRSTAVKVAGSGVTTY